MAEMTLKNMQNHAHFQIDEMCVALQNAAAARNTEGLPYLAQALAVRIKVITGALMVASEDDYGDLVDAVFGGNNQAEANYVET